MALFTESRLRRKAQELHKSFTEDGYSRVLNESTKSLESMRISKGKTFDIFLSHSRLDAEIITALKAEIEGMGYTVYVDWVIDKHLDRSKVSKETAAILRNRMGSCSCLFFATSDNSPKSNWMPWELGYFDGSKPKKVAILPISKSESSTYVGQEYLGLYPYVSDGNAKGSTKNSLWIHESKNIYVKFHSWLKGTQPSKPSN